MMNDQATVLGIASRYGGNRAKVTFVAVSTEGPTFELLAGWRGTRGTDLASQLADVYRTVHNRFDPLRPQAIAVKRAESPIRRPPAHYDARVAVEAVVMLAAEHLGCRHFDYRTQELRSRFDGQDPMEVARGVFPACVGDDEAAEAAAAAYAALGDLGHEIEI
jgi:hypothetical protein